MDQKDNLQPDEKTSSKKQKLELEKEYGVIIIFYRISHIQLVTAHRPSGSGGLKHLS
jgi:hypothetical protein